MALIAAHLNAGHSSVDSVAIGIIILSLFPHLHTPLPPFSPSLISLTVSVDVKHQVYLLTYPSVMWQDCHHSGGDRRSVTSVVSLFPQLLGFRCQPVPLRRQLGVTSLTNIRWGSRPVPWQLWNWLWRRKNTIWMLLFFSFSSVLLMYCCFTFTEARWPVRDGDRVGRGRESEGSTAETARKGLERPWTAARTMEVLRRCPLAIAQRLVHCAIAVSTAVLGQSHKDNVRCTAVDEQLG